MLERSSEQWAVCPTFGFRCLLSTVVVPAVQFGCGPQRGLACLLAWLVWRLEGMRSRVEVGEVSEAVGGLAQCPSKMPWIGEHRHHQRLSQGEPM